MRILAAAVLGAVALGVSLGASSGGAKAQEGSGVNGVPLTIFAIEVPGAGCHSLTADRKCEVEAGSVFTVRLSLLALNAPPEAIGYNFFAGTIIFDSDLTLKNRAGVNEMLWPDCDRPSAFEVKDTTDYTAACSTRVDDGIHTSSYTGTMLEVDLTCDASGGHTIGATTIVRFLGGPAFDSDETTDTLTVNCVEPPLVGGMQADLADAATSSNATGAIAGAGTAVIIVLVGIAWNLQRRVV
jgi:hypothetical protein